MSDACTNFGILNGSTCACPVGFGGADCSQPSCGGTIFQGTARSTVPKPPGQWAYPNLTASACTCEAGWTGVGCNVCQTANACQVGYNEVHSGDVSSADSGYLPPTTDNGQNQTITCNTATRVYAASSMSCAVIVRAMLLL